MIAADRYLRAEQVAAGLPALLLRARRLAASLHAGSHGRRRPGSGEDFWQFRQSQPGDSLTSIDWRQSARSDHLYIRETEWTTSRTTRVWVDPSSSMRWRSGPGIDEKYDRAALLAIALGFLLEGAGERIGLLGQPGPAFYGRTAPARLAAALDAAAETPIIEALPDASAKPRTLLVILSDFLMPLPAIEAQIRRWGATGLKGHLLQILDPAEEALPYRGRVRLLGLEAEGDALLPHAESLDLPYQEELRRHREGIAAIARQAGWRFSLHHTDSPARAALLHLHAALTQG